MRLFIVASFLVAFVLALIPMGIEWRWFRPEFVVLLVIYWSMFTPQHFGLGSAWLAGLMQDIIELSPLGFNAIGMLLISYISFLVYQRIRSYRLWHQAGWVFVLVGVFQLFSNWLGGFFDKAADSPIFLIPAVLSGFLWPLLVVSLNRMTLRLRLVQ